MGGPIFFMRIILLALLTLLLLGCATDEESAPAEPKSGNTQVGANELFIALSVKLKTNIDVLPPMVYVFPPILVDQRGTPLEQLSYITKPNGAIEWSPPTQVSAHIQQTIQQEYADYGYKVVDFERVSNMRHAHEILVINSTYSPAIGDGNGPYTLFTHMVGSTFPVDLSPERQTIRFDMSTQCFFLDNAYVLEVIAKNFAFSIQNIGQRVGVETKKLPLGQE